MHEPGLAPALRTVFMIYAAFWVVVITVLLIAVGPLLKKWERGSHGKGEHH